MERVMAESVKINKIVLQSVITDCENRKKFTTLQALFTEVAKSTYGKKYNLTADEWQKSAVELGCTVKTNGGVLEAPRLRVLPVASSGKGKPKLEITPEALQAAVDLVESQQAFSTLGELWEAVANTDWGKNFQPKPLSAAVVYQRVREFEIKFKTVAGKKGGGEGGKAKLDITAEDLQAAVNLVEKDQTFESLGDLWEAVAATEWAKTFPKGLSTAVINQRVREFEIKFKTVAGKKRGKQKLEVTEEDLQAAVNLVETDRTFESLGEFWEAVAATEWAMEFSPKPLSVAVLMNRASVFGTTIKTQAGTKRGKEKLEVTKEELERVINTLESQQTFETLSDLWVAVEGTQWAKEMQPRPLTSSVVSQRAKEYEIVTKTQPKRKVRSESLSMSGETKSIEDVAEEPVVEKKVEARRFVADISDMMNAGVPRRKDMMRTSTPSGECPFPLRGTDIDTVETWSRKVLDHFYKQRQQMLPTAILYFAHHYYNPFTKEYELVESHLNELKQTTDLFE